jgi:hypothetical protein
LFQLSIPPRRTVTCSNPAFESISAALDERFSVRQMVIIGFRLIWVSSRILADSSAIGMFLAPAMRPSGPRNSSALRTSIKATSSKEVRLSAQSAKIEARQVHLPRGAAWLDELRAELLQFPHGRYDDQVDSISQFLNWIDQRERMTVRQICL